VPEITCRPLSRGGGEGGGFWSWEGGAARRGELRLSGGSCRTAPILRSVLTCQSTCGHLSSKWIVFAGGLVRESHSQGQSAMVDSRGVLRGDNLSLWVGTTLYVCHAAACNRTAFPWLAAPLRRPNFNLLRRRILSHPCLLNTCMSSVPLTCIYACTKRHPKPNLGSGRRDR
jgi:hypothetical protein